jgi:hypothetical protein
MKTIVTDPRSDKAVYVLLGILVIACIAFSLLCAWKGFPLYRDIHLGTAVEYSKHSINIASTQIVGFNATGTPTIQEFPIWQMLAAMALKTLGPWWGWTNAVSSLIFVTSLYPLYMLGRAFMGHQGGLWTLVFYLTQPLVFRYFGLASTDGTSVTAMIWFLYLGYRILTETSFNILLWSGALIAGTFTALLKLPFFMSAGLALLGYHLLTNAKSYKRLCSLASIGFIVGCIFLIWTRYTDKFQSGALFPFVDLRISNPDIFFWYFGDLEYRLNPAVWIKGGWRILNCLFGSFVILGLLFLGIFKPRPLFLPLCLLGASGITIMIFTHLILHHSHYYLMLCPAVAMLCANAFIWLKDSFPMSLQRERGLIAVVGILLALSLIQGLMGMKITENFDPYSQKITPIVEKYTLPTDKLLIQGGGWGGDILTLTNRTGLSIWGTKFLENPANLKKLKDLGYNKLVMISESPLMNAIQATNPGQSERKRESYETQRTEVARQWPILYQTEDIIIQEIP